MDSICTFVPYSSLCTLYKVYYIFFNFCSALTSRYENFIFDIDFFAELTGGHYEFLFLTLTFLQSLLVAKLTYSFHCCAFQYPARHDPVRHELHQVIIIINFFWNYRHYNVCWVTGFSCSIISPLFSCYPVFPFCWGK